MQGIHNRVDYMAEKFVYKGFQNSSPNPWQLCGRCEMKKEINWSKSCAENKHYFLKCNKLEWICEAVEESTNISEVSWDRQNLMTRGVYIRASSISIFSYFLTKFLFFLFFREIPISSYFLATLHLFLVFYSLFITISCENIPYKFLASLPLASKYFSPISYYNLQRYHQYPISVIIPKGSLIDRMGDSH